MLRNSGRTAGLLAAIVLMACNGSGVLTPPGGLSHAAAIRSCGAADGATAVIYLRGTEITGLPINEPYLQVSVSGSMDALEGHSWRIAEHHDNWAAFRSSSDSHEAASSGVVAVTSVNADTVIGNVTLSFPSGREIRGGFHARRIATTPNFLCG